MLNIQDTQHHKTYQSLARLLFVLIGKTIFI